MYQQQNLAEAISNRQTAVELFITVAGFLIFGLVIVMLTHSPNDKKEAGVHDEF